MRDRTLRAPAIGVRRLVFFGLVAATTAAGAVLMLKIVRTGGLTPLEVLILLLFAPTFGWISLSFWNAVTGFVLGVLGRDPLSLRKLRPAGPALRPAGAPTGGPPEGGLLASRTALVMPVFDEDPVRTLAGLDATLRSLAATGLAHHFHVFLLSDTADPEIVAVEEKAWAALVESWERTAGSSGDAPSTRRPAAFHYRRREERTGRKAGNVADFCRRWGSEMDFMVVLDADSVMTGPTLVELVRTLEANPGAALLQTVPVPVGQRTPFARLLGFAARLHSPMLAAGQAFWQGDAANYWGHNAIVRVDAFIEEARLPVLPGGPPLGGEILSHDFVEAALLRRAGWGVWLLPGLGGSHEDVPGNVLDYAARDRRWCQGSLQHLRLLPERGLHPLSRLHFLLGAMGYAASPLWMLMLLASTAYVALEVADVDLLLNRPASVASGWPLPGLPAAVSLLAVTAAVLFLPKALGTALAALRRRGDFGGGIRLLAGSLAEGAFAVVIAPVMMMFHTRFVVSVLAGRTVSWIPQSRGRDEVSWGTALRGTAWITAAGSAWSGLTLAASPAFFLWLSPIFLGLWTAAPLVRWTGAQGTVTDRARIRGLGRSSAIGAGTGSPPERPSRPWSGGLSGMTPGYDVLEDRREGG